MALKLSSHGCYTYDLPYERPVRWSDIVETAASFVALELMLDDGTAGFAEVTAKPTWNGVTPRLVQVALDEVLLPRLRTMDLSNPDEVHQQLQGVPEHHAAKALINNALWDALAQRHGKSLAALWHGSSEVEVSWALTRQAPTLMAQEAEDHIARYGFRTLKVKGGQGLSVDVDAVRAIRAAVGGQVRLYVDANGAYPPDQARDYVAALANEGVEVAEDPSRLRPGQWFAALQGACTLPVLVDFDARSRGDAQLYIESGAQALSVKPGRLGLSETRAIAATARDANVRLVVGLFGESAVGTLAALQLAATLPDSALPAEVTWYLAMQAQLLKTPLAVRDGRIRLPGMAGVRDDVDRQRLRRM